MTSSSMYLCFVCILSSVLLVSAGPRRRTPFNCTNYRTNLDIWANELYVLADRSIGLPESEQQLNNLHCVRAKSASKKLRDLRVCLKPFPAQVLDVILNGARKTIKKTCNEEFKRREFVENTACARPAEIFNVALDCIDHYVAEMEYVRDHVTNVDMKTPYTCCYYWKARRCFLNVIKAHCPESSRLFAQDHMDSLFSETTDLLCNKWEEGSNNCRNNLPKLPITKKSVKQALTFVLPNLDIYTQT